MFLRFMPSHFLTRWFLGLSERSFPYYFCLYVRSFPRDLSAPLTHCKTLSLVTPKRRSTFVASLMRIVRVADSAVEVKVKR